MKFWRTAVVAATLSILSPSQGALSADRVAEQKMLAKLVAKSLAQAGLRKDAYSRATAAAMSKISREKFVPKNAQDQAYLDKPLPIGYDQTISSPSMVAFMTSLAHVKNGDTILEVGTGSGYQAAVLGLLAGHVYSIEIVEPLATEAAGRLKNLGYSNIAVRGGDGYTGWPEHAPFDAIIVTAGATHIPPALIEQLKPGGRMVLPLGPNWAQEQLTVIEKQDDGTIRQQKYGQVFFVDFTGEMRRHK